MKKDALSVALRWIAGNPLGCFWQARDQKFSSREPPMTTGYRLDGDR